MTTIFRAFDGKEFDNERECLCYEESRIDAHGIMLGNTFKRVKTFNECFLFTAKDEQGVSFFEGAIKQEETHVSGSRKLKPNCWYILTSECEYVPVHANIASFLRHNY